MTDRERLKGRCGEGDVLAIYEKLRAEGSLAEFCRQFMHDEDHRVIRNALWVLTKARKVEMRMLQPMLNDLIELAMATDNSTVRRLSLNIVERLTLHEEDIRTDFLDFCLEHMTDTEEPPGIQSLCMKLAFRMCSFYPELAGEFQRTIEAMEMEYYSPAVRSVRNRIIF